MAVQLAVAGAFHTDYMAPAVDSLKSVLEATQFSKPRIPVVSNVDAQPHSDPEAIKAILAKQVTCPVLWEESMQTLLSKGLEQSYELGPGKVVAGIFSSVSTKRLPSPTSRFRISLGLPRPLNSFLRSLPFHNPLSLSLPGLRRSRRDRRHHHAYSRTHPSAALRCTCGGQMSSSAAESTL